jgi:polysaccharide biosynthesis transport protein
LSGIVTFFLISFLILLAAFFDSSVKSPSLYEKQLGIKPSVNLGLLHSKRLDIEQVIDGEPSKKNKQITLQYRNAISTLRLRLINERIKSVIFASFEKGEGKSTIIEALARSLSKAGKKILIVDANFSNNNLTQKFGAKEAFQELAAKGFGKQAVHSQIIETPIAGVSILGCANGNETPIEVLTAAGAGLKELFDHDQFDFVLIEVASLNFHTDGFELLPYTDSIVSVCAASSTITNSNAAVLHHLSESGNKYLGAILNKVDKDVLDI